MLFLMISPYQGKSDEFILEYAACLQKMEDCSAAFSKRAQNALTKIISESLAGIKSLSSYEREKARNMLTNQGITKLNQILG